MIGVSLWIGIGFQNQVILPDLLTGTLGTLLSNGMTTGSVCVIFLTLLMEFTSRRRRRLNVAMSLSSLPKIDSFLQGFATKRRLERGINKPAQVSGGGNSVELAVAG